MSARRPMRWGTLALRLALGAVLVYASLSKIAHPDQFADAVANYRLAPEALVPWLAIALPWLELLSGVCLITGVLLKGASLVAAGMFTAFAVAIVSAQARHLDISCGCFTASPTSGESHSVLLSLALLAGSVGLLVVVLRWPEQLVAVPRWGARPIPKGLAAVTTPRVTVALLAVALVVAVGIGLARDERTVAARKAAAEGRALELLARRDLTAAEFLDGLRTSQPSIAVIVGQAITPADVVGVLERGSRPDVIGCGADQLPWLVRQGYVGALDAGRLSQWDRLDDALLDAPGVQHSGAVLGAPVDATVYGLLYRTDKVRTSPRSYGELLLPQYKKRSAMPDDAVLGVTLGAAMLGLDSEEGLSVRERARIQRALLPARSRVLSFYRDETELGELFRAGLVDIAVGDVGTARRLAAEGIAVAFAVPKEGAFVRTTCLTLPASSRELDPAYAIVDYYLSPAAQAIDAELWGRALGNEDAAADASASLQSSLAQVDAARVTFLPAPPDLNQWQRVWHRVMYPPGHG